MSEKMRKIENKSFLPVVQLPVKRLGRAPRWENPEQLERDIRKFYEWTLETGQPFLWTSLAVWIGVDRATLNDYSVKPGFAPILKRARSMAEDYLNRYLVSGKPPIGALFLLKNHHGYVDKHEVEHNHNYSIGEFLDKVQKLAKVSGNSPPVIEGEVSTSDSVA